MKLETIKYDITKPGAVDALIRFHRHAFGDARMEGDGGDAGTGDAGKSGGDGDSGDQASDKAADGASGDGDKLASEFAEARTGRKSAEKALAEITGKTVTQVRKAFKDAKGDPVKAVEILRDGDAGGSASDRPKDAADAVDEKKIREAAERDAREATDAKFVRSGVRLLAAETFANPSDALHNLDLSEYDVDEDGELTDPEKVKRDLAKVLTDSPHYAKKGVKPKPDASQGAHGAGSVEVKPGLGRLRHAYETTSKTKT